MKQQSFNLTRINLSPDLIPPIPKITSKCEQKETQTLQKSKKKVELIRARAQSKK